MLFRSYSLSILHALRFKYGRMIMQNMSKTTRRPDAITELIIIEFCDLEFGFSVVELGLT